MKRFNLTIVFALFLVCSCADRQLPSRDWEQIISEYKDDGSSVNYLKVAELNLALAQTGRLAEDVFKYTQAGQQSVLPDWDKTEAVGAISSDVYYAMGHIAYSQRMAFEANVLGEGRYVPEMMERLIQTNLIFEAWEVAEKYIRILEKDGYDCGRYRAFLRNPAALDADPEFGPLRRCVPPEDAISFADGLEGDLKEILRRNPSRRITLEYLGVMYLLDCNMEEFRALVDEFYGTEVLPKLPRSFAEAACMMSELEKNYWKSVGVDKQMFARYRDFKSRLANGLSEEKYKDTFWFYMMRVNSNI